MLDRGATPMLKGRRRRLDRAFRLGNSRLRNLAHDLVRRAWIERCHPLSGRDLLAIDHERIFFAKLAARCAQRGSHLLLCLKMDKIDERSVLVAVAGGVRHRPCGMFLFGRLRSWCTAFRLVISSFGSRSNCAADWLSENFARRKPSLEVFSSNRLTR